VGLAALHPTSRRAIRSPEESHPTCIPTSRSSVSQQQKKTTRSSNTLNQFLLNFSRRITRRVRGRRATKR
jgi:hypothetical protein